MKAWYFACFSLVLCSFLGPEFGVVNALPGNATTTPISAAPVTPTKTHIGVITSSIVPSPTTKVVAPTTPAAILIINATTTTVTPVAVTTNKMNQTTTTSTPPSTPPSPKLCSEVANGTENIKRTSPVAWLPSPHVIITQEGRRVNLHCPFCLRDHLPNITIYWYKDSTPLKSGGSITVYGDMIKIQGVQHKVHEGVYWCSVGSSTNQTETRHVTLIVNKAKHHLLTSVVVKNISDSSLKLSWQLYPHKSMFDYDIVQIRLRQVDSYHWSHHKKFLNYISGSAVFEDLQPQTQYIANVTALHKDGMESWSIVFWSYSCNSTGHHIPSFLSHDFSTRKLIGLGVGLAGIFVTLIGMYMCLANPTCTCSRLQGYRAPAEQGDKRGQRKDKHTHNQSATCVRCSSSYYTNGAFKIEAEEDNLLPV